MRLGIPGAIMNARYLGGQDERAIGREDLRELREQLLENLPQLPTPVAPPEVVQSAMDNLPVNMQKLTFPDLGPLGTSGMSVFEGEPMTMTSEPSMSPMMDPEVTPMDSDIDRAITAALSGLENPILNVDEAVKAAVGNGQPTTDDTILEPDDMPIGAMVVTPYYNPATGETFDQTNTAQPVPEGFIKGSPPETPAQPDFMTQLQELIAQMQAEQTAAAEAQAAAEQQRQEQVAAMTQNYMVGQPAVGYNPYESGQYQNNPYGAAGVPAMGGITTIPVPAAYNPNPYTVGGMT
tara:strand:+ start:1782 stop:2660 length:879 start_codon:yes stop_codon:yes gene_type:complete